MLTAISIAPEFRIGKGCAGQFTADRGRQFRRFRQADAPLRQRRKNVIAEVVVLAPHQPFNLAAGGGKLFGGTVSGRIGQILPHLDQLPQTGDPHHEKFIQVAAENCNELQPLQQRIGGSPRLVQHPGVEIEPAQFAAEKESGIFTGV